MITTSDDARIIEFYSGTPTHRYHILHCTVTKLTLKLDEIKKPNEKTKISRILNVYVKENMQRDLVMHL